MADKPQASTRKVYFPFNINDTVRVRLTDRGRYLCRAHHDGLFNGDLKYEYRPKAEDKDGWSEWQLWELMSVLGHEVQMGFQQPIETVIEFSHRVPFGQPDAS